MANYRSNNNENEYKCGMLFYSLNTAFAHKQKQYQLLSHDFLFVRQDKNM